MKAFAVVAGIVFWTLVIGVAVLMFLPGGDNGEPVAVIDVDAVPPSAPAGQGSNVDLPPGFSVTGPAVAPVTAPQPAPAAPALAPPGQGTTMMPVAPGQPNAPPPPGPSGAAVAPGQPSAPPPPPGPSGALETPETQGSAAGAAAAGAAVAALTAGIDGTPQEPFSAEPVSALVEDSPYGPLPAAVTGDLWRFTPVNRTMRKPRAARHGSPCW